MVLVLPMNKWKVLTVVISVLVISVLILIPLLVSSERGQLQRRVSSDLSVIVNALEVYRSENGVYPNQLDDLISDSSTDQRILTKIPKDLWGSDYAYIFPALSRGKRYDLFSMGADRKVGGNDADSDIHPELPENQP